MKETFKQYANTKFLTTNTTTTHSYICFMQYEKNLLFIISVTMCRHYIKYKKPSLQLQPHIAYIQYENRTMITQSSHSDHTYTLRLV